MTATNAASRWQRSFQPLVHIGTSISTACFDRDTLDVPDIAVEGCCYRFRKRKLPSGRATGCGREEADRRLAFSTGRCSLRPMSKVLSVLALAGGIWLLYLGYERQISIAGKADRTLSRLGTAIDGGDHTPTHT